MNTKLLKQLIQQLKLVLIEDQSPHPLYGIISSAYGVVIDGWHGDVVEPTADTRSAVTKLTLHFGSCRVVHDESPMTTESPIGSYPVLMFNELVKQQVCARKRFERKTEITNTILNPKKRRYLVIFLIKFKLIK